MKRFRFFVFRRNCFHLSTQFFHCTTRSQFLVAVGRCVGGMIRGERDLNTYDLLHNQAAFVFKTKGAAKAKDPLNIHLLNLLMDRIHDVKISHRVSSPDMERMVRGSDHRDVSSEEKIGPGRYDVNRSHSYLDKTDRGAIDFGLSKSCRSSLIRTSSYNENSSVYSHLEGTSPARPHTGMPSSSSSLVKAGSTSRSSTSSSGPRRSGFGSGVSRSQIQRSFSSDAAGMGLDPEWDKRPLPYGAFSKSVLVKKKETNASSFTERSDVDCGKKTSLATSVRLSHRAYSAAFRYAAYTVLYIKCILLLFYMLNMNWIFLQVKESEWASHSAANFG